MSCLLITFQLYLEFLLDPLLVIDEEVVEIINSQNLYITEKVRLLIRKWRASPQGDLASAIFACWRPFRYDSAGLPNLGRDWPLLAGTLTRSKVSAKGNGNGAFLTHIEQEDFQQKLFLTLVECFDDTEGGDGPPLHTRES
jgi:hypothetical protein